MELSTVTEEQSKKVKNFICLSLDSFFNNDGISFNSNQTDGDFDCFGQTFPAEELPKSNHIFLVNGVKFQFPDKSDGCLNNICLAEQRIYSAPDNYSDCHILGASDGGSFQEDITFHYSFGFEKKKIGLTDFFLRKPVYAERIGIRCTHYHSPSGNSGGDYNNISPTIWHQTIKLNSKSKLTEFRFEDNYCMHIFCITLEAKESKLI